MVFNLLLRFIWVRLNTDSDSLELLERKLTNVDAFHTNHRKHSVYMSFPVLVARVEVSCN